MQNLSIYHDFNRLRQADRLQELQGGFMDPLHVAVGQWLVLSAHHAGTDSRLRHRDWPGAHGAAGIASATAAGKIFDSTHAEYSSVARISSVSGGSRNGLTFASSGE